MEEKNKIVKPNVFVGKSALYVFGDSKLTNGKTSYSASADKPWYPWGDDNNFPQEVFESVYQNDIKPDLVETSVNLMLGDGISYYLKVLENGQWEKKYIVIDPIERLFEDINIQKFCIERATNLELFANAFTEGIEKNVVTNLRNVTCLDVRAEFYNAALGRIMNFYLSGDWKKARYVEKAIDPTCWRIPAFNKHLPQSKWIHHSKYYMPGQDYYSFPIWWFGTKDSSELSNLVWKYQLSNVKGLSKVKLQISGPASYFDDCNGDEKLIQEKKQELQTELDSKLLNAKEEDKASIFYSWVEVVGGVREEWEIKPININAQDKTFLESYNVSSRSNTRGHGVHPVLSGIDFGGNITGGAEIRNLFNYHLISKLPKKRQTFLEIFYDLKAKNKWDSRLQFEINYQQMVTGDTSHSGLIPTSK